MKLSDESGALEMTEVARGELSLSMLCSDDVMMLDCGDQVFLWIGGGASTSEGRSAMRIAMDYLKSNSRPMETPISIYKEHQRINNKQWTDAFDSEVYAEQRKAWEAADQEAESEAAAAAVEEAK